MCSSCANGDKQIQLYYRRCVASAQALNVSALDVTCCGFLLKFLAEACSLVSTLCLSRIGELLKFTVLMKMLTGIILRLTMQPIKTDDTGYRLDADYVSLAGSVHEQAGHSRPLVKNEPLDDSNALQLREPHARTVMDCVLLPQYEDVMRRRRSAGPVGNRAGGGDPALQAANAPVKADPGIVVHGMYETRNFD